MRSHSEEASPDPLSAIDYFATANGAQSWTQAQEEEEGREEYEGSEDGDSDIGGKRKRKEEEREVRTKKKKKKKTKSNQAEVKGKDVVVVKDAVLKCSLWKPCYYKNFE